MADRMEPISRDCIEHIQPDDDIVRLIGCLQSLVEGQSAVEELVACGPKAIEPLRDFLLSGRITSVPQPRMWAVEALAALKARNVIVEYLRAPSRVSDPVLRLAEDGVKNTAARRLRMWPDDETFAVLLELGRERLLPGIIESLSEFARPEGIPCLDRALEDDFCRVAAEEGFRRIGPQARSALLYSALTPLPNANEERPSSRRRRRSALALLTEIGVNPTGWTELKTLLSEQDPEVIVRLAQIASVAAQSEDRAVAAAHLVGSLVDLPWYLRDDSQTALLALVPESVAPITTALRQRSLNPARAADEMFRTLSLLYAKIENNAHGNQ
jgi:hypothetical protein